jgi:RNA recognition motif-containing protein
MADPATRLYVGNLPYTASEADLRRLFGQAGTVESVTLPTERETGRPRGFGFVEMATPQEAETAMNMFNGYRMDGRELRVNIAKEREIGRGRSYGGGYGGYSG